MLFLSFISFFLSFCLSFFLFFLHLLAFFIFTDCPSLAGSPFVPSSSPVFSFCLFRLQISSSASSFLLHTSFPPLLYFLPQLIRANECSGGGSATPIHSPHRPPPWQHSFQFSPRFRLITLTSLRLPLSGALIRYPLHFTLFYLSLPLFVCVSLSLPPLSLSLSVLLIVRGFKRLSI